MIDNKELTVVKTQVTKAVTAAQQLQIKTDEDAKGATDLLAKIKAVGKMIAEKKEAITRPLNEALKETRALFAPLEASYTEAERMIKNKMVAYSDEIETAARKKAEQLEARVNRGTMKMETASEKIADLPTGIEKVESRIGTLSFRTDIDFEIIDEQKIPRAYLVPDLVAIRKAIRAGAEIEGVKKVERKVPVSGRV